MCFEVFASFHSHFPKTREWFLQKTSYIHSLSPEIREWVLQKQAFCTPSCQILRNGFSKIKSFPLPPAKTPGMDFTQTSFLHPPRRMLALCALLRPARTCLAMPLRWTPRSVNSRCRRKATPSEGSTYRSEPVERSRMCPREGERSPRAYKEAQGASRDWTASLRLTAALRTGQTSKRTT